MPENLIPLPTGRKSAFAARNRALLIKTTQVGLAEIGSNLTLEDVAERADMAVSTLYKHFTNREQLINLAIRAGMTDWEEWSRNVLADVTDPLESLVLPMRLLVKMQRTHPIYAQIAAKSDREFSALVPDLAEGLSRHVLELANSGILQISDVEARLANLAACLFAAFQTAAVRGNEEQALVQIRTALDLLGIDQERATELMTVPLPRDTE